MKKMSKNVVLNPLSSLGGIIKIQSLRTIIKVINVWLKSFYIVNYTCIKIGYMKGILSYLSRKQIAHNFSGKEVQQCQPRQEQLNTFISLSCVPFIT